ncbi:Uma2 family endonuclease [Caenispirillum salinarum]|uniref:Uma2 family endonuclease n=1 Tax=Caenispirillum salinarum TaxID=859058 RepID=UPI000A04EF9F|nr:Uma2 family endonuclease [Caenispirillum salinarum]
MEQDGIETAMLEEFEALDFGDQRAQLIAGRIVVADWPLSDEEGILTATLAELIGTGLRRCPGASCRLALRIGLRIRGKQGRRGRDSYLTPTLTIQCHSGNGDWTPIVVVEVLSGAERRDDVLEKIEEYKSIPTVADILIFGAREMSASHHRRDKGIWLSACRITRPTDILSLEQWSIELRLSQIYQDLST